MVKEINFFSFFLYLFLLSLPIFPKLSLTIPLLSHGEIPISSIFIVTSFSITNVIPPLSQLLLHQHIYRRSHRCKTTRHNPIFKAKSPNNKRNDHNQEKERQVWGCFVRSKFSFFRFGRIGWRTLISRHTETQYLIEDPASFRYAKKERPYRKQFLTNKIGFPAKPESEGFHDLTCFIDAAWKSYERQRKLRQHHSHREGGF